jgi:Ser/Thr protein kinase RdoA (MazF antagonist)
VDITQIESLYTPAALRALESFPVEVESIELVAHSENVTFRVSVCGSDSDYVLRLHRPGYNSIEELNAERMWTRALSDAGVIVQDSLETYDGAHYVLVDIPGVAEQRYAGMTPWHEGKPLREFLDTCSEGPEHRRIFHRFGEIVAAFHNQSTRWQVPPGFIRRRLDVDGLLGKDPFWGRFWEHPELTETEQALLLRARATLRASLAAYGETPENFSLIHADFTPDNIIYDGDDLTVIDFDDAAYGWHMYDIASALIECLFDHDFEEAQAALLQGYCECRSLAMQDLDMLPDFLLVRGMAIIGWFHQRPEYAGAAYFEKFRTWVVEECKRRES